MFVLQDIRKAGAPSAASPTKGAASSAQLPILRFILPYFLPSAKQAVEISGICDFAVEWRTSLRYNEVTKAFFPRWAVHIQFFIYERGLSFPFRKGALLHISFHVEARFWL